MEHTLANFCTKVYWPSSITACWLWGAGMDRSGYGTLAVACRKVKAHRVAYELFRGPIPQGLHIDHLCRVRRCVNPVHLEAVTKMVNDLRGMSPQALNARKTRCNSGHEFTPENTYVWTRRSGRPSRACRICRDEAVRRYQARRTEVA